MLLPLAAAAANAAAGLPPPRLMPAGEGVLAAELAALPEAASYEAMLAEDVDFTRIVDRQPELRATRHTFSKLKPDRVYHLRVLARTKMGSVVPGYPTVSRGTLTAAPPGSLVLNIYSDDLLAAVTSDGFERFIRDGDLFLVVDGNTGRIADPAKLNRLLDGLVEHYVKKHAIKIRLGIYTTERVDVDYVLAHLADGSLRHAATLTFIAAGYEPESRNRVDYEPYPPLGGFHDDLDAAVPYVRTLAEAVHRRGLKFMLIPTGRPLGSETRKFTTGGAPGWDYAKFITDADVDFVLIQMQSLAHRGGVALLQERFAHAKSLFDDRDVPPKMWNGQVSIQRGGNFVDVATGVACVQHMLGAGGHSASIWTSAQDRSMLIESVQRLRTSGAAQNPRTP